MITLSDQQDTQTTYIYSIQQSFDYMCYREMSESVVLCFTLIGLCMAVVHFKISLVSCETFLTTCENSQRLHPHDQVIKVLLCLLASRPRTCIYIPQLEKDKDNMLAFPLCPYLHTHTSHLSEHMRTNKEHFCRSLPEMACNDATSFDGCFATYTCQLVAFAATFASAEVRVGNNGWIHGHRVAKNFTGGWNFLVPSTTSNVVR